MAECDKDKVFDVAIVGAGLVGSALAIATANAGREVVLFEQQIPTRNKGDLGFDLRTVALSPTSLKFLASLGVDIKNLGASFTGMQVWEERGTEEIGFSAEELGRESLGQIVEVSKLVMQLWQMCVDHPNIRLITGAPVETVNIDEDCVVIGEHRAKLIVGADGARSSLRGLLDVETESASTGHWALATVVTTELSHQHQAYQRFLLEGPLALLPLENKNACAVVWSQSENLAKKRSQCSADMFCQLMSELTEHRLGNITACDHRLIFPLTQMVIENFAPKPRCLFLGDAARVVHPLAGLGVNIGFEDARGVAGVLSRLTLNQDIGESYHWRKFARGRGARARMMTRLMTGFRKIYARPEPAMQLLRNLGVSALNHNKILKRAVIEQALGPL